MDKGDEKYIFNWFDVSCLPSTVKVLIGEATVVVNYFLHKIPQLIFLLKYKLNYVSNDSEEDNTCKSDDLQYVESVNILYNKNMIRCNM